MQPLSRQLLGFASYHAVLIILGIFLPVQSVYGQSINAAQDSTDPNASFAEQFLVSYCSDCHSSDTAEAGFSLEPLLNDIPFQKTSEWERVVHRLTSRQMPPLDSHRPSEIEYQTVLHKLTEILDRRAAEQPLPGRTPTFRRMTQTEYRNAIRDLLDLDIDVTELLPADESSHGFDNITVTGLSPTLLDKYVSAAQKIGRLAIGTRAETGAEKTYRIKPDVTQDVHLPGTPLGTRGGMVATHYFPQDAKYEIQVWLMRDRNEEIEGLRGKHELDIFIDRKRIQTFTIQPPPSGTSDAMLDAELTVKVELKAGPHELTVAFAKNPTSLQETLRQPLNVHFNYYRHPRIEPAVYQVTVRGPLPSATSANHASTEFVQTAGTVSETPSRRKIFVCYPTSTDNEDDCARQILERFLKRAYRREITEADLEVPWRFYKQAQSLGFDIAIESAVTAILVNPNFLFRIERTPSEVQAGTAYQLTAVEIASRLSFFLWSSIPDEELLRVAIDGSLLQPNVLDQQVRRMLSDPKSESLVENFADQWLYLRNLDSVVPDMRLFPDFDDNLRQAFRRETELLFESVLKDDRSIVDLIDADYTFLNERLAKHYEIDNVYGSHFRKVSVDDSTHRGGLLRHGSVLSVTSYATRTSPVLRGHWVLKNLLGSSPPPPPPDIPALADNSVAATLSVRDRLEQHRADASCSVCHNLLDPVGLALENFDAVGRWREQENGRPLLADGGLPDGSQFVGVSGLEQALLKRPELLATALAEKLLTFALGRGIEHHDAAAIRQIVRDAAEENFRFSSIVLGITKSVPFQMRTGQ